MTRPTVGFSVRIFVPSGEPDGLRLVEKSNWMGQGLVFPRSLFAESRQRPQQHEWLQKNLKLFQKIFAPILKEP
jgi:hypothetical protein